MDKALTNRKSAVSFSAQVLPFLLVGFIHLLLVRVCLLFVRQPENLTIFWLPGGFGVAAYLLATRTGWRNILSALVLSSTFAGWWGGRPLFNAAIFACVWGFQTWLIVQMIIRTGTAGQPGRVNYTSPEQVLKSFAYMLIGTLPGAFLFSLLFPFFDLPTFLLSMVLRWAADFLGVVLVYYFCMSWYSQVPIRRPSPGFVIEALVVAVLQLGPAVYIYFSPAGMPFHNILGFYNLLPPLIWSALRFDERYTLSLATLTAVILSWGVSLGLGKMMLQTFSSLERMAAAQMYLGVMIFVVLLVIALMNDRKAREAHHRQDSAQFQVITGAALDGFWVGDRSGLLLDANDAFCRMLGFERAELLGTQLSRLDAQDMDPWSLFEISGRNLLQRVYRGQNGRLVDVELSLTFSQDPDRCLAFVRDISERKRLDRVMAARMRLVEFAPLHSLDELLTATLDEAEALTGSCIGFYHFVEDDQVTLSLQNWSTRTLKEYCKAGGKGSHYPISSAGVWVDCVTERRPVIHNDYAALGHRKGLPEGHAELVRELVVPILRGERIVCILGVGNKPSEYLDQDVDTVQQLADLSWDITERKRAEISLKKYETLLRETQAITGVGGWEYDVVNHHMVWTDEVYRIYGVDRNHDPDDFELNTSFYSEQDRQRMREAFEAAVTNGESYDLELGFINAQGSYRWVSTSGRPVRENGKIIRVTGNIVDITRNRIAEEALIQAYKNLEAQNEANKRLQVQLLEQAMHDSLTTLYNRRFMEEALSKEITRAEREHYPVAVILLDIDHFKALNDTFGHETGDLVLVMLGEIILECVRESDYACRYGGEEFVIILPGASEKDACARADEIREIFANKRIISGEKEVRSTISAGVSGYPHQVTRDGLLRAADAAMYAAKQAGRNRVMIWSEDPL